MSQVMSPKNLRVKVLIPGTTEYDLVFIPLRMISFQDFPGSPVVKTLYSQQREPKFDPSLVTEHKLKDSVTVGLSYPGACGVLVHRAGIKSTYHALAGRFLTTRPPRKSQGRSILNADTYHRITPERLHSCVFLASVFPDGSGGKESACQHRRR